MIQVVNLKGKDLKQNASKKTLIKDGIILSITNDVSTNAEYNAYIDFETTNSTIMFVGDLSKITRNLSFSNNNKGTCKIEGDNINKAIMKPTSTEHEHFSKVIIGSNSVYIN